MTGATSPMLRRLNAQAVLDALLDADPTAGLSGADLMDATRLSRPTVHAVCDELIARGWLTELDSLRPADSSRPGRRARVYAPLPGAGHVLGVDMGATTVRAAVADLRGVVLGEDAAAFRHDRVPAAERIAATRAACRRAAGRAGVTALLGAAVGLAGERPGLLGTAGDERSLRRAQEGELRAAARLAGDPARRVALVDEANAVRPRTRW